MAQPSIQLIDKSDFTKQHLVSLTSPLPLPPLTAPNTARIRARTISLTTNNFTYAKRGGIPFLGWWGMWPMPPPSSLPAPFNDPSVLAKYCRIPAWGYGEVVESTIPELPAGTLVYGQQPIGTLAETVELAKVPEVDGHWQECGAHRAGLNPVYNRYVVLTPHQSHDMEGRGWDALMGVLHQTAYLVNRFVFSWREGQPAVHPLGSKELAWTEADADLSGAVVVVLAASGKTALCLASEIRSGRPADKQPAKLIAVGSEMSRAFTAGTGLFDEVLLYTDVEDDAFDMEAKLGAQHEKAVLMDFGARGRAVDNWAGALAGKCKRLQVLVFAADPLAEDQSETVKRAEDPTSGVVRVWAGGMRDRAIELVGAPAFFADQDAAWSRVKADGAVPGLQLKWGNGLHKFAEGWDALAGGEFGPDVGLVYEV